MEPLSIATGCVGLLSSIATLSKSLTSFVSIARQARKDIDGFSRELSSLQLCISSLKDEAFQFPPVLQKQLLAVLFNCNSVIDGMMNILNRHLVGHLGRQIQWSVSDRDEICRLRERLEAHKSALEITLELASLTVITSIKEDTTDIKAELAALRLQVMQLRDAQGEPNPILQRYLNESIGYVESVVDPFESTSEDEHIVLTKNVAPSGNVHPRNRPIMRPDLPTEDQRMLQKEYNNAAESSSGEHPSDAACSSAPDEARNVHTNLLPQDHEDLDRQLWECLSIPLLVRASASHEAGDSRSNMDLKKAGDLINPGARFGNGVIVFGYGVPFSTRFCLNRPDSSYQIHETASLSLVAGFGIQELMLRLNHGHSIQDEPSALLRYLSSTDPPNREVAKFLLDRADVRSSITRKMTRPFPPDYHLDVVVGNTALHLAASQSNQWWLIPELVKHGADVNQKNSRGQTTLDFILDPEPTAKISRSYWPWVGPKEYIETLRILKQSGARTTYKDGSICRKMCSDMLAAIYYESPSSRNVRTKGMAGIVASRHGLVVKYKRCLHISCCPLYCDRWGRVNKNANQDLIRAYQKEMMELIHGSRVPGTGREQKPASQRVAASS